MLIVDRIADLICDACRPRLAERCTAISINDLPGDCPDCWARMGEVTGGGPFGVRILPHLGPAGRLKLLAHHEAGHAVSGLLAGARLTRLDIETVASDQFHGVTCWDDNTFMATDSAIAVSRAGQIAGRRWLMERGEATEADLVDNAFTSAHDSRDIERYCARDGGTADRGFLLAEQAMTNWWLAVKVTAERLLNAPGMHLDGTAVRAAMAAQP